MTLLTTSWTDVASAFAASRPSHLPIESTPVTPLVDSPASSLASSVVDTTTSVARPEKTKDAPKEEVSPSWWLSKSSGTTTVPNLSPIQEIFLVDLWKEESSDVFEALEKVADVCSKNDLVANVVFEMGGPSIIVGVMLKEKWSKVAPIQAAGCKLLHSLAQNYDPFRPYMNKCGVLDTVALAMMTHEKDVDVQDYGCGVLGEAILAKEHAEYCVSSLNAIPLIVSAMKNFPDDARVQLNGSMALFYLLEWDECKNLIADADGDRALLEARKNHLDESKPYVKHIQNWTRVALLRLFE